MADNEALMGEMNDAKSNKSAKMSSMSKKSAMMAAMSEVDNDNADMCCCCVCKCSEPRTVELGCCCLFPIKCGVIAIGVFILLICLV
jgi:hypothetical protein